MMHRYRKCLAKKDLCELYLIEGWTHVLLNQVDVATFAFICKVKRRKSGQRSFVIFKKNVKRSNTGQRSFVILKNGGELWHVLNESEAMEGCSFPSRS